MHGLDPKQMTRMMQQMGIQTKEVNSNKVVIETDENNIIIENPSVTIITMKGQDMFQITGNVKNDDSPPEDDIKMVMDQTNVSREQAEQKLKECDGDIAEAITQLSE